MEWIKCSEKMPKNYQRVRIKTLSGRTGYASHSPARWTTDYKSEIRICAVKGDVVTHWLPL
ncbi:DUF551 domain-containing protein [Yersinia rochesterensis]|uniref:DUF551 domain-containing protein n=1 Tax=Yersinia rochesterensis TaxID=1604335 RepID=UPI0008FFBAAA|nr:DUF551 domain-containing protein [Yersinia enterocolitica]